MKKTLKKIFSAVLVAVMLFGTAPLSGLVGLDMSDIFSVKAEAASYSGTCGDNLTWSLDTSTGLLEISGTGNMDDYDYNSSPWYSRRNKIKTIVIEEGVTSIGGNAFYACVNLTKVTISNSIVSIGDYAFAYCMFTSITIPSSVKTMGNHVFYDCSAIENIIVDTDNLSYSSDEYGVLFDKDKTTLIQYPRANARTSYIIPDGVTTINERAFASCSSLASITISDRVTTIDEKAFTYCSSLVGIIIPDSVTSVGKRAFASCSKLSTAVIGKGVTSIGDGAFEYCDELTNVIIGDNVTYIGTSAFYGCSSISEIELPYGITNIYPVTFSGCSNLSKITIPNSVTSIGNYAFQECSNLTNVVIPDSVTSIGVGSFNQCSSLENITIGSGVTSIGDAAFNCCTALKSITIPNNVTEIGVMPFWGCLSLTFINVDKNNQYYTNDSYGVLYNKNKTTIIQYPAGNTATDYIIPNNVACVESGAFMYCVNLINISIPSSVKDINRSAFLCCSNLANVIISSGVTNIVDYAFAGCKTITNIVLPDSVTSVGAYAFSECTNLEYIHIPSSVKSIGDYVLNGSPTYICNVTEACYAKTHANEKSLDFRVCLGHETNDNPSADTPTIDNIYNLGEETYSFDNFLDSDSWGHCFGMSMTSSGYYIDELDVNNIGINSKSELYSLSLTSSVKSPICKYQAIQGSYSLAATVAGGSTYKTGVSDIESDWEEVINHVKNHDYDNSGSLQIGFRKDGEGGHAINFLRYEEVNGQARIYAYDNNFPDTETYFYKDSSGNIKQAPYSTFSGAIDCIALRDVATYFGSVDDFDSTRYIYAEKDNISVSGVKVYPLDGGVEMGERVVFEIPANMDKVTITPLVNNAEFTYLNEEYSFGKINNDTVGVFTLSTNDNSANSNADLSIVNKSEAINVSVKTPSTTTISYGDAIILHADVVSLTDGAYIKWTASNSNFSYSVSSDGTTCTITPSSSGDTTFTATVYDKNGNAVSSDEQVMTSKAGFFDKLIAFFKKLFGLTKTIAQSFESTL